MGAVNVVRTVSVALAIVAVVAMVVTAAVVTVAVVTVAVVTVAVCSVVTDGGVVWDSVGKTQTKKPPIGNIRDNILFQLTLGANAIQIAD